MMNAQSFLSFLPEAVVLIVAGKYMVDYKRSDIRMIFIGSLIHVLVRVAYFVITAFSIVSFDSGSGITSIQNFLFITGILTFIGSVVFCAGLLRLMKAVIIKL
jgi:hypothetical protein